MPLSRLASSILADREYKRTMREASIDDDVIVTIYRLLSPYGTVYTYGKLRSTFLAAFFRSGCIIKRIPETRIRTGFRIFYLYIYVSLVYYTAVRLRLDF